MGGIVSPKGVLAPLPQCSVVLFGKGPLEDMSAALTQYGWCPQRKRKWQGGGPVASGTETERHEGGTAAARSQDRGRRVLPSIKAAWPW